MYNHPVTQFTISTDALNHGSGAAHDSSITQPGPADGSVLRGALDCIGTIVFQFDGVGVKV